LGTRTAIRTTVRPQLAHGRDSQSRPNLSYRRLEVLLVAKFRPLAARGSAQPVEPCTAVLQYSWAQGAGYSCSSHAHTICLRISRISRIVVSTRRGKSVILNGPTQLLSWQRTCGCSVSWTPAAAQRTGSVPLSSDCSGRLLAAVVPPLPFSSSSVCESAGRNPGQPACAAWWSAR
jgi:hypothetical protein